MKTYFLNVLLLLVFAVTLFNCKSGSQKGKFGDSQPDSVVYKETPQGDLKMYFSYPDDWAAKNQRPLIVYFSGGGWVNNSIEQFQRDAEYFAQRGLVTARADYRVKNRHGTSPVQCVEDAKSAIRWVRENAGILGIDPGKIIAAGGSAGGHMAICTRVVEGLEADREDLSVSSKPNLLLLYNPVLRTTPDEFIERFGSEEIARKVSPNDYLREDTPPMILFFGTDDRLGEYAYETLEKSADLDLEVELWFAEGEGHAFFNKSPWKESTIYLTDKFLIKYDYLECCPDIEVPDNGKMELYK